MCNCGEHDDRNEREVLQDHMATVHSRINDIKRASGGAWPKDGVVRLSPSECVAVMSALETAGEL